MARWKAPTRSTLVTPCATCWSSPTRRTAHYGAWSSTTPSLGTATADPESVLIEFSVDGGQTFTTEPTVDVRDEAGQLVRQPAPAAAYTHIRWTVQGELAQGASVTASFDATLGSGSPNTY